MESNYKRLGDYITEVDVKNTDSAISKLVGISISKKFIDSVANIVGTDLSKYKIIKKGQFACNLMHVGRDGGIAISLYKEDGPAIMSTSCFIFEVSSKDILPEYLELIFNNPEFDRDAVFYANCGVRATLTWEDFCELKIPIPELLRQKKIVNQFNAVSERINILKKVNEKLEYLIDVMYEHYISDKSVFIGRMKELGVFVRGKNITAANMVKGDIDVISAGIFPSGVHNEWNVAQPSITISSSGVNAGFISLHFENIWAADCSYNNNSKHIIYLYESLKSVKDKIEILKDGHSAQPHVYPKDINEFEIMLLPENVLCDFDQKCTPFVSIISNNLKEIKQLIKLENQMLLKI